MTAARYDLVIDQGSDFAIELTVKENETVKNDTSNAEGDSGSNQA